MPQMRSFSAFQPAPNLSQSWLGGVGAAQQDEQLAAKIMLEREQMANQSNIAGANRDLEREQLAQRGALAQQGLAQDQQKLAQEMQMAQMIDASRKAALEQEMLQKVQELEVDKMYKQGVLGIRAKEQEQENAKIQAASKSALQQHDARQQYQQEFDDLTSSGADPAKAQQFLMQKYGPSMDLNGAGYRGANVPSELSNIATPVKTADGRDTGYLSVPTRNGAVQLIQTGGAAGAPAVAYGVQGDPSKVQITTGKTSTIRTAYEVPKVNRLTTEIAKMQEDLTTGKDFQIARAAVGREALGKELTAGDVAGIKAFREQQMAIKKKQREIAELEQAMEERSASSVTNNAATARQPAALPPGMGGGSTNQTRRLRFNPKTGDFD